MKKSIRNFNIAVFFVITAFAVTSCGIPKALIPNWWFMKKARTSADLRDNPKIYDEEGDTEVIHLYATVMPDGNSFRDLASSGGEGEVSILLQEGDESRPLEGLFGYGASGANAKMKLAGNIMEDPQQNSYNITLDGESDSLYEIRSINLNKNPFDLTKMRNKLAFDYFRKIDNLVSARTRFVTLHIKDLSAGDKGFVDYGLYTGVEEANADYLKSHGLDPQGMLYKAQYFEFIKIKEPFEADAEPGYTKENFNKILEVKAGSDHKKVLTVVDDINNPKLNSDGVIERYFNKNNYLTWLAVNIIMGNLDANAKNFMLYSASDSPTWYFLPYDNATSMGYYGQTGYFQTPLSSWQAGVSNYWVSQLHRQFISNPQNLEALTRKIEELKSIINRDTTLEMLNGYYRAVSRYINADPATIQAEIERIAGEPQKNIERYYDSLYLPMPVFTSGILERDDKNYFSCQDGVSLIGGGVYYDFVLGHDPEFNSIIEQIDDSTLNEFFVNKLGPGVYYYKISLKNDNGDIQLSFDKYDDGSKIYFGVRQCIVE
ncbi:MAG: Inner spore coat protein H [Firmicutes bacterium ADurb.Bin193]|nr:MAG: Inner spore coat protein H [Firmicutes bacterium ADurb.Bin193]